MSKTFRTILPSIISDEKIHHRHQVICIGSCFAEHIAKKLTTHKFDTILNPFGILYNPASINKAINQLIGGKQYEEKDLFLHNGLWNSYDHHGKFSKIDKTETLSGINHTLQIAAENLKKTDWLIITFGTAFVFELIENQAIVANCHKVPAKHFSRRRLSLEEILKPLTQTFEQLKSTNPNLKILLSVSPVRHIRDGLIENTLSKATLHLVVDTLVKHFDFVQYFPAYELIMDDLRDYRFFNEDMVHPNDMAVNYVWDYFSNTFFDSNTVDLNKKILKIKTALQHRPFNPKSTEYQRFLRKTLKKIEALEKRIGYLDFGKERNLIREIQSGEE